jgi:drug/metabolite transporter (DMT)-like permease
MGYIYLLLAVLGSAILGVTYKLTDRYKCDKPSVNFFLFLTAGVIAAIMLPFAHEPGTSTFSAGLAITLGLCGFINVSVFRIAVSKGKISTSWTIANLSLVIPVVASIVFWHEIPKINHLLGFLLVIGAILLIGKDIRSVER